MAGRPKKREREALEQGYRPTPPDPDAGYEKGLTAYQNKVWIEEGRTVGGNGSWPNFDELPQGTLEEYRRRAILSRRMNLEAKKLGKLEAYIEANRQYAGMIIGGKLQIASGILAEMRVEREDEFGNKYEDFDTSLVDEKRLALALRTLESIEKVGGLAAGKLPEEKDSKNVSAVLAALQRALGGEEEPVDADDAEVVEESEDGLVDADDAEGGGLVGGGDE